MMALARSRDLLAEVDSRGAKLTRLGSEWVGPCPVCGGRDRFSINTRKRLFNCRGCQLGGDVIRLVQHLEGCDFASAVAHLAGVAPVARRISSERPRHRHSWRVELPKKTAPAALTLWEQAGDPRGTAGELYFNRRGLEIPAELAGDVLRFHNALLFDGRRVPGLVALFRDVLTDEPTAVQQIFRSRKRRAYWPSHAGSGSGSRHQT